MNPSRPGGSGWADTGATIDPAVMMAAARAMTIARGRLIGGGNPDLRHAALVGSGATAGRRRHGAGGDPPLGGTVSSGARTHNPPDRASPVGLGPLVDARQEGGHPVQYLVEDRSEGVAEPREGHQLGLGQELDRIPQQLDTGEGIRFP